MAGRFNYGKVILVICLTVLIWVWADLAVDETYQFSEATIQVTRTTDSGIWVSFDEQRSVELEALTLVGPTSKISEVRRRLNEGTMELKFFLNPSQEGMTEPGSYTLDVLEFLRENDQLKQMGLSVKSCDPMRVGVTVVGMEEKLLDVRILDENSNILEPKSVDPSRVSAYVPSSWSGQMLVATASLSEREIDQARVGAVLKKPQFDLTPGWSQMVGEEVEITMPAQQENLVDFTVTSPVPGFVFSANLEGDYSVELLNRDSVLSPIAIRATAAARRAYESQRYQVLLEIDDSDRELVGDEPIRRELIYDFPGQYVRRGEIELKQQRVVARFRLIPVEPEQ